MFFAILTTRKPYPGPSKQREAHARSRDLVVDENPGLYLVDQQIYVTQIEPLVEAGAEPPGGWAPLIGAGARTPLLKPAAAAAIIAFVPSDQEYKTEDL
jgi:hypothetical protein